MKKTITFCKMNNINGIVFGILSEKNTIDKERCSGLIESAKPMKATLHRAFDAVSNPLKSLEEIISCGFERILTSGQKSSALQGVSVISGLIEKANGRISIMPGGGVRAENISELRSKTGANEFHSSALDLVTLLPDTNEIQKMKNLLSL
jgi:copper homeostasis protein